MGIEAPFLFSSCLEDICWKQLEDQTGGSPSPCDILFTDMSFWWWHIISLNPSGPCLKNSPRKILLLLSLFQSEKHIVITVMIDTCCLVSQLVCWAAACLFSSLLKGIFRPLATAQKQLFLFSFFYFSSPFLYSDLWDDHFETASIGSCMINCLWCPHLWIALIKESTKWPKLEYI